MISVINAKFEVNCLSSPVMDYRTTIHNLLRGNATLKIYYLIQRIIQSAFLHYRPKGTTPSFLQHFGNNSSFTPTHLEHLQNNVVLYWSPDKELSLTDVSTIRNSGILQPGMLYTKINLSKSSHSDMAPPMTYPKAAVHASQEPSLKMARNDAHDTIPKSDQEGALSEEHALKPSGMATAVQDEAPVEFENTRIGKCLADEQQVIAREKLGLQLTKWLQTNCLL